MSDSPIELRARLESLELDQFDAVDTFSLRLARENRWTTEYTAQVIREYRRFLLLVTVSEELMSPSDAVDQAWHLHLLDTRNYRRFCRNVLGRRLEHTPSRGGQDEHAKFDAAYARTLERYRQTFSEEPPPDVWPPLERRFDGKSEHVRVDVKAHWILPKPHLVPRIAARFAALAPTKSRLLVTIAALAAVGSVASVAALGSSSDPAFLRWLVVGWAVSVLAAHWVRTHVGPASTARVTDVDAYEVAYLAGGGSAAVDSAAAMLVATDAVTFDPVRGSLLPIRPVAPFAHPLEAAAHAGLPLRFPTNLRSIRTYASALTRDIARRLRDLGLITDHPSYLPLIIALVAPVAGALRLCTHLGTDRPIGWLVALTVLTTIFALALGRPSRRTRAGETLLRELKFRHAALPYSGSPAELARQGTLPLAIGLFGFGALRARSEHSGQGWLTRSTPRPSKVRSFSGRDGVGWGSRDAGGDGDAGGGTHAGCGASCGGGCGGGCGSGE